VAAIMTGSTQQDYAEMMLKGGRSVEGNRSKSEKTGKKAGKHVKRQPKKVGKKRG
jgi:protocatechuate 4,5-dioxygenase alpha chain